MSSFFISDLHLQSAKEPNAIKLIHFLHQLNKDSSEISGDKKQTKKLFLVGDIFDLWIADHSYFIEKYAEIIECIQNLKKSGCQIYYFEGNHDLYLKKFWQEVIEVNVISDILNIQCDGFQVRIEHGDLSNPQDHGYLFLRWFLRTKPLNWLAYHLPENMIQKIGEKASVASRNYTAQRDQHAQLALRKYAEKIANKKAEPIFDLMIAGHTHFADSYTFQDLDGHTRRLINLGTWLKKPQALKLEKSKIEWLDL